MSQQHAQQLDQHRAMLIELHERLGKLELAIANVLAWEQRLRALEDRPEPDTFSTENKLSINAEGKVE